MTTFITIFITALATLGISSLISQYNGAFDVFQKLRNKFPRSPLTCTVCLSVWVAIPLSIFTGIGFIGYLAVIGLIIIEERFI